MPSFQNTRQYHPGPNALAQAYIGLRFLAKQPARLEISAVGRFKDLTSLALSTSSFDFQLLQDTRANTRPYKTSLRQENEVQGE